MSRKNTTKDQVEVVVPENDTPPGLATDWLRMIESQVRNLRFGSIGITIHDGRVVQIETSTKVRFDKAS
ncbi:MAG: YezD family protein [Chthoniobacterales bacterium]